MSNPASSKHGPYRKPRADVYTVLLIIALVAVLVGCLFAYLETADYPDKPPWSGAPTSWLGAAADAGPRVALAESPAGPGRLVSEDRVRFPFPG
jgi:hypothetical protein